MSNLPEGWPWSYEDLAGTSGHELTWDTLVYAGQMACGMRRVFVLHPEQLAQLPDWVTAELDVDLVVDDDVPTINDGADWMGACIGERKIGICSRRVR